MRRSTPLTMLATLATAATFALATQGCDESDADSAVSPVDADRLGQSSSAAIGAPALPTLADLDARLDLSDTQETALAALLADWAETRDARGPRGPRGDRPHDGGPGYGRRARAGGADCPTDDAMLRRGRRDGCGEGRPDGAGGQGGPGQGLGSPGHERPMVTFLTGSAPVLSDAQMLALVTFLVEWRDAARDEFEGTGPGSGHGGPGRGGPGRMLLLGGSLRDLELTADQRTAVRELVSTSAEALRELLESVANDAITAEALRDAAKAVSAEFDTALADLIGAEAFATVLESRLEHLATMAEHRIDRLDDMAERRLEHLTAILELDEDQVASVGAILEAAVASMAATLQSLADGSIDQWDAMYAAYVTANEVAESIAQVLDTTRAELFAALRDLVPMHGGPGPRGRL